MARRLPQSTTDSPPQPAPTPSTESSPTTTTRRTRRPRTTTTTSTATTGPRPTAGTRAGLQPNTAHWQNVDLSPLMTELELIAYQPNYQCKSEAEVREILGNKDYDRFVHKEMRRVLIFRGCDVAGIGRWPKARCIQELITRDRVDGI